MACVQPGCIHEDTTPGCVYRPEGVGSVGLLSAMIDYYVTSVPYGRTWDAADTGMAEMLIFAYSTAYEVSIDDATESLGEILTDAYIARNGG